MERRIAIIGHFGGDEFFLDGQTVKTKIMYNELKQATNWNIIKVDTYYKSRKPIKLLKDTFSALLQTKDVVVLLSENGMKWYFPILYYCSRFLHTRVYHNVIGGNLDVLVNSYPKFRAYLNSFQVNWVETESLHQKMIGKGVFNCDVIPNFKRLNVLSVKDLNQNFEEPYRFCTFSRVMKEKGIENAIEAVEAVNSMYGKTICTLDIYGVVDDNYQSRFEKVMRKVSTTVRYCGAVPYDKSVETIKTYYALLFPTFWCGEGFPGTIVDAFSAGLPVIATDWNCNCEIVRNGYNGILYPNSSIQTLKDAIAWMISHQTEVSEMRKNCIYDAGRYQPDQYIKAIIEYIKD